MKFSKLITLIVVSVLVAILFANALNVYTHVADSALADNTLLLQGGGSVSPRSLGSQPRSERDGAGGEGGDGGNAPRTAPGKNYLPIIFLNAPVAIDCINTINGIAGGGCASSLTLQLTAGGVITSASGFGLRINNTAGSGSAALYAKVGAGSGVSPTTISMGLWADSFSSPAILATTDSGAAVSAIANTGIAVNATAYGSAPAISGNGLGFGPAVSGNGYIGVDGIGTTGVRGTGDVTGVLGIANSGFTPNYGVYGQQSGGSGIFFLSSAGVWGDSKSAYGVVGTSISGTAIYGSSQNGNAMHLERSVNGTGSNPADNVAVIENTNTGNSADVLALKIGSIITPTQANNFITFLNGNNASVGSIEGDGAGGVHIGAPGNDYAEYLPRANANEALSPGDIVGVFNGRITKATRGAPQVMVVSTGAIVAGNDPGENKRDGYALVAFIGQARVRVRGIVRAGDFIIPSGDEDGTGIAVSPGTITSEQFAQVVGQAWGTSNDAGVKNVNVAVGLIHSDPTVARLVARNQNLEARVAALEQTQGTANGVPANTLPISNDAMGLAIGALVVGGFIVTARRKR